MKPLHRQALQFFSVARSHALRFSDARLASIFELSEASVSQLLSSCAVSQRSS